MNLSKAGKNWVNILLILLVVINIIGDIGNIALWNAEPSSQESLMGGYIASLAGAENALTAGTIILAVVSIIYIASLLGLLKKQKWGPLLVIAISIANRAIAVFLYLFNEFFFLWFAWTIILLIVAFLDFRKLSANS
jgi:hypothetical protein